MTWTNALDTRDWEGLSPDKLIERLVSNFQPGGVVLLHDIQQNTAETVPALIDVVHGEEYCINPYRGEEFWDLNA